MKEYFKKVDNIIVDDLIMALDNGINEINNTREDRDLKIYTNKEICEVLGIKDKLLRKYRYKGLLSYSKCGDKYWYTQTDIDEFMANNKREAFC